MLIRMSRHMMNANGYVDGIKHPVMAARLQVNERELRRRLGLAVEAELLRRVSGPAPGVAACYRAMLPGRVDLAA